MNDYHLKIHPSEMAKRRRGGPKLEFLKLKFCVIEEIEDRIDSRTNSPYSYTTVLTSGGRVYGLGIDPSQVERIQKDKFYRIHTPTPINGIFHLEEKTKMEEIKKFAIAPEKIQEALYPPCMKVSDLTEEKLITIAIRTRLSVQGYVQLVSKIYDEDRCPKRTLILKETMEGRRPATMFIRLWREKTEINPKVGSLVQVLSLKLTDYKDSREIHSTPSTVLRGEVSEEQPPTQTDTQAASQ